VSGRERVGQSECELAKEIGGISFCYSKTTKLSA